MSENMQLWNAVCKTDPKHTKQVTFGRKFTAIDAMYQIQMATEQWGSFGKTWGIKSEAFNFHDVTGKHFLVYYADFYYPDGGFPIHSSMLAISEKGKPDEDCFKKLATDALTKGLSKLGFNADVFLGKFDDNKYVQQMKNETSNKPPPPPAKKKPEQPMDLQSKERPPLETANLKWLRLYIGEIIMMSSNDSKEQAKKKLSGYGYSSFSEIKTFEQANKLLDLLGTELWNPAYDFDAFIVTGELHKVDYDLPF